MIRTRSRKSTRGRCSAVPHSSPFGTLGLHWVSDLALEGDVEVQSDQGELLCLLVKGGVNYVCRIDIASGKATLSMDDGAVSFVGSDGTSVTGAGRADAHPGTGHLPRAVFQRRRRSSLVGERTARRV